MKQFGGVVAVLALIVAVLQLVHDVFDVGLSPREVVTGQDDGGGGGGGGSGNGVAPEPPVVVPGGDSEPPTTPQNLRARRDGCDVILEWDASADNQGVASYRIFQDGGFSAMVDGGSTTSRVLTFPGSDHVFTVQAIDGRNNESPQSAGVTVSAC